MNLRIITVLAALLTPIAAHAQTAPQPPDPAFLQAALGAVRAQRDANADGQAAAQAQIVGLNDEIAKLKARIAELEKKPELPK